MKKILAIIAIIGLITLFTPRAEAVTLTTGQGGTGTSIAPTYGQLLLGNALGGYNLVSTSSLGITSYWGKTGDIMSLLAPATVTLDQIATTSGANIITNGSFTGSANDWTLGDCASYYDNNASSTYYGACSSPTISQAITWEVGKQYKVSYTVSGNQGDVQTYFDSTELHDSPFPTVTLTPTTYTFYVEADSFTDIFYFDSSNYTDGDHFIVDDISITEVVYSKNLTAKNALGEEFFSLGGYGNVLALNGNILFASTSNREIKIAPQNDILLDGSRLTISAGSANTDGFSSGGALLLRGGLARGMNDGNVCIWDACITPQSSGTYTIGTGGAGYIPFFDSTTGFMANQDNLNSLLVNTSNTVLGTEALYYGAGTGSGNVVVGRYAGSAGAGNYNRNTLVGHEAVYGSAVAMEDTTAFGYHAGYLNTGYNSTFLGEFSGQNNTSGHNNITIGYNALVQNASASNQLNIGNIIFGTNLPATSTSAVTIPPLTGNIGIGTTSPWAKLSVQGAYGNTSDLFSIASSTNASGSATTSLFLIDYMGKVAIKASHPNGLNTFEAINSEADATFAVRTTAGYGAAWFNMYATAEDYFGLQGFYNDNPVWKVGRSGDANGLSIYTLDGSTKAAQFTDTQQSLFFGSVGIGTTSPYAKLSVVGEIVSSHFTATSTTATSTFKNVEMSRLNILSGSYGLMVQGHQIADNAVGGLLFRTSGTTNAFSYNSTTFTSYFPITAPVISAQGTSGSLLNLLVVATSSGQSLFQIDKKGHTSASLSTPVLSTCGTTPSISGNDKWGIVTGGTGATACTITFYATYTNVPACNVTMQGGIAYSYTVSTSNIVVTSATLGTGKLNYICNGIDE